MAGFLFALIVGLAAGLGARDQVLVARLPQRGAILLVGMAVAAASAALAAWSGSLVLPLLNAPARTMLVALALGLAAAELLIFGARRRPEEPSQSLGALGIVLFAHQLTDAARLLIFAIAAASPVPMAALLGGALGCAGTILAGWLAGPALEALPLAAMRRGIGAALALVAVWLAL